MKLRVYHCGATDQGFPLTVLIGPRGLACAWLKRTYNAEAKDLKDDVWCAGANWFIDTEDGRHGFVWFEEFNWSPEKLGVLGHELFHLLMGTMKTVGIPWCDQTEESYAYDLQASITKVCRELGQRRRKP